MTRRTIGLLAISHLATVALGAWLFASAPDTGPPVTPKPSVVSGASAAADALEVREVALAALEAPLTRADATLVLGWVAQDSDVERLWELGGDVDPMVARRAIAALGRAGGEAALGELVALATDPLARHRDAALMALGDVPTRDAHDVLADALRDPAVRDTAATALAIRGDEAAAKVLTAAFQGAHDTHADSLAGALASFPEASPARRTLHMAVRAERAPQFQAALHALADVRADGTYDTLVDLLDSPVPSTRRVAITALETLGDPRATDPLLDRLNDASRDDVYELVSALVSFHDPAVHEQLLVRLEQAPPEVAGPLADWMFDPPSLQDADDMVRIARARPGRVAQDLRYALYVHDWVPGAVPRSVLDLAREDAAATSDRYFTNALAVLLVGGDPRDRAFVEDLAFTGTRPQRRLAMDALASDPSPAVDTTLLALVADPDPMIVEDAIVALEERGPAAQAALVDELVQTLGRQPAGTAWGVTEATLARIGGDRAVGALLDQVRNGTLDERDHAVDALLGSGSAAHREALTDLLPRVDDGARRAIVTSTLAADNAPRSLLLAALDDPDEDIVSAATWALAEADGPAATDVLLDLVTGDAPEAVRDAALGALVEAGPADIEGYLADAIDDPELARTALNHLSELGTDAAGRVLADVALDDPDPDLREAALSSLTYSGVAPDELQLYLDALDDPEASVRTAAVSGLESLGTTVAAEALLTVLDRDHEAAVDAAEALERMGGQAVRRRADLVDAYLAEDTGLWD